jgi:hypothetical protein
MGSEIVGGNDGGVHVAVGPVLFDGPSLLLLILADS